MFCKELELVAIATYVATPITSDKSHSSFVTIAKKVSESIVISSYEQNKKQDKKHMINYSIDMI